MDGVVTAVLKFQVRYDQAIFVSEFAYFDDYKLCLF